MDRKKLFLQIYRKAVKKYGTSTKRLAGEKWGAPWRTLITTILSAQSRDEYTIPTAEKLFKKFKTLRSLADAKYEDVFSVIRGINYNRTKTRNVIAAANFILGEFKGKLPDTIEEMTRIPGVGRKTANLVLWETYGIQGITVDTHVHRISNVLGIVKTKNPEETEMALREIVPKKYWGNLNRIFVLWGKEVPGNDKNKLMDHLKT